jgi:hypothetical protein
MAAVRQPRDHRLRVRRATVVCGVLGGAALVDACVEVWGAFELVGSGLVGVDGVDGRHTADPGPANPEAQDLPAAARLDVSELPQRREREFTQALARIDGRPETQHLLGAGGVGDDMAHIPAAVLPCDDG